MEKLLEHKHCPICQSVMPKMDDFCSDGCKARYDEMLRKRKRTMWIFYIIMGALFAYLLLQMFLAGRG